MLFTSTLDEDFSPLLEDTFSSLEELSTTLLEECFSTLEELSVMLLDDNSTFTDDDLFEVLLEESIFLLDELSRVLLEVTLFVSEEELLSELLEGRINSSDSSSLETVGVEQAAKNAVATQAKDILKKAFFTP